MVIKKLQVKGIQTVGILCLLVYSYFTAASVAHYIYSKQYIAETFKVENNKLNYTFINEQNIEKSYVRSLDYLETENAELLDGLTIYYSDVFNEMLTLKGIDAIGFPTMPVVIWLVVLGPLLYDYFSSNKG